MKAHMIPFEGSCVNAVSSCSVLRAEARFGNIRHQTRDTRKRLCRNGRGIKMVGATRFELVTFCTPSKRATRLRYAPTVCQKRRALYQNMV